MRRCATTLQSELSEAELAAMVGLLKSNEFTDAHLEIGTAAGGTLVSMLLCYQEPRPKFMVVDPFSYFPDQRETVERNLRQHGLEPGDIDFREGFAWNELEKALESELTFDFIFIDADHGPLGVTKDLRWSRLLNAGGYLCMHDHQKKFPSVIWAAKRFLKKNANYRRVDLVGSLLIIQKTALSGKEVSDFDVRIATFLKFRLKWSRSIKKKLELINID